MKIGIIGATGKAGQLLLAEAIQRGHEVTAIVRNPGKLTTSPAAVLEKDVFSLTANDLHGFDAIINAFGAPQGQEHLHVEAGRKLIELLSGSKTRLLVVGGAGSLFVDPGKTLRLMDTPEFPAEYKATAQNQGQNLMDLQATTSLDWTFLSPAIFFNPEGKRTGTYQAGLDHVLPNQKGDSYVSYADYAIALLDEIEQPQHRRQRFTVVSEAE